MSKVRTFIDALKTGETTTTKALERVLARRTAAEAAGLVSLLEARGALNAPLQTRLRGAVRAAPLREDHIAVCIDGWPNAQKERARQAIVKAFRNDRRLHVRWGLTDARSFEVDIDDKGSGTITITARSPRASLRVSPSKGILVAPND
jgi:hypothetical protein